MSLDQADIESIADLTAKKLCESDQPFYVPREDHYHDHLLIKKMREDSDAWSDVLTFVSSERRVRERRQDDVRKLRNQVFGALMVAGVFGLLGLIGTWGISALVNLVKSQGG
ncbi:MAG: hypothetical protein ACJA1I_000493 [Zhongshania marina]